MKFQILCPPTEVDGKLLNEQIALFGKNLLDNILYELL
jgi:hypothetical protein